MSRSCECNARCKHRVRGGDPLLMPDRLVRLSDVIDVLVDSADAFDSESLAFDSECGVHGAHPTSNTECICRGQRFSALEYIRALELDVRSARSRTLFESGHRPRQQFESGYRRRGNLAVAG